LLGAGPEARAPEQALDLRRGFWVTGATIGVAPPLAGSVPGGPGTGCSVGTLTLIECDSSPRRPCASMPRTA
jgi:hypothetical protein